VCREYRGSEKTSGKGFSLYRIMLKGGQRPAVQRPRGPRLAFAFRTPVAGVYTILKSWKRAVELPAQDVQGKGGGAYRSAQEGKWTIRLRWCALV